jgi:hypothetical protein
MPFPAQALARRTKLQHRNALVELSHGCPLCSHWLRALRKDAAPVS